MTGLAEARNQNSSGTWYWIIIKDVSYHCWVHDSTVELEGDPSTLFWMNAELPVNESVPAPTNVQASRSGNQVTVSWNPAPSAPELGYLLEGGVCVGGAGLANVAYSTSKTSITVKDDGGCSQGSFGTLRTSNKLGYSSPVRIPWPN